MSIKLVLWNHFFQILRKPKLLQEKYWRTQTHLATVSVQDAGYCELEEKGNLPGSMMQYCGRALNTATYKVMYVSEIMWLEEDYLRPSRYAKPRFTTSASQHKFLYHRIYRNASTYPVPFSTAHCTCFPTCWIATQELML